MVLDATLRVNRATTGYRSVYVQGQACDLLCSPLAQLTALTGVLDAVIRRLSQSHDDQADHVCHVHVTSLVPGTHAHGCSRNVDPAPHCEPGKGWRVAEI